MTHVWPNVLPDGRSALFTILSGDLTRLGNSGSTRPLVVQRSQIALVDIDTGEYTVLLEHGSSPRYASSGHIVYGFEGALWAVGFDPRRKRVTTEPTPVQDGVNTKGGGAVNYAISVEGDLVYVPGTVRDYRDEPRSMVWVDRAGTAEETAAPRAAFQEFSLAPDDSRVAVRINDGIASEVWAYGLDDGTSTRLTLAAPGFENQFPTWSDDGRHVAVGGSTLSWKAADGIGAVEVLAETDGIDWVPQAFGPEVLIFQRWQRDLGLLSLSDDRRARLLWETPAIDRNADLSPDGRWLVYESDVTGQFEVWAQPFPDVDGGGGFQVSSGGGRWPLFNPTDARELFYVGSQGLMSVTINTRQGFGTNPPRLLFETDRYSVPPLSGTNRRMDVSSDGQRFLMLREVLADPGVAEPQLRLVLDWFEELERLVPTN